MDSNYRISLLDIGLVIDKLMGNGYVSEYSKKEFKAKYFKIIYKKVNILERSLSFIDFI
jgi:hypothetical protein